MGGFVVHLVCTPMVGRDNVFWWKRQDEAHFVQGVGEIVLTLEGVHQVVSTSGLYVVKAILYTILSIPRIFSPPPSWQGFG